MKKKIICQVCGSSNIVEVLNLGYQPLCCSFKRPNNEPETFYPLVVFHCRDCDLGQLSYVIPQEEVFQEEYFYLSGTTKSLVEYFNNLAKDLVKRFHLKKGDIVIDIGGNDGTFLKPFKEMGMEVLNIDGSVVPANIAIGNGIPTIKEFWDKGMAEKVKEIVSDPKRIKLVTAMNVLAHNDCVNDFVEEIRKIMNPDTVFVTQSHYLIRLFEKLQFDTVYHEHLRYYCLRSLLHLYKRHGLHIFDAEVYDIVYGGSLVVYATLKPQEQTKGFETLLEHERKLDLEEEWKRLSKFVKEKKRELMMLLMDLKKQGKTIIGSGAPMKCSTFLNYFGITPDLLDYATEVNELKWDTIVPGVHIPVRDENLVFSDPQPDYALILAWNIKDQIMANYRKKGFKGKFIIPIPPQVME